MISYISDVVNETSVKISSKDISYHILYENLQATQEHNPNSVDIEFIIMILSISKTKQICLFATEITHTRTTKLLRIFGIFIFGMLDMFSKI